MTEVDPPKSIIDKLLAQQDQVGEILRRSPHRELAAALTRQNQLLGLMRQPALDALTRSRQWPDISATMRTARLASRASDALASSARLAHDHMPREAHRALATTDAFTRFQQLYRDLKHATLTHNHAILLHEDAIRAYTERTAAALCPTLDYVTEFGRHQTALVDRLTKLTTPWALRDYPALSATGVFRLTWLRGIVAAADPYTAPASDAYQEEVGDPVSFDPEAAPEEREAAAIESGMNPEVVAFPPVAYPHVLVVAGFDFNLPAMDAPTSDKGDSTGDFDSQYRELLQQVEHRLRTRVETELGRVESSAWVRRRVPKDIRDKWDDRKQQDHDRRGDSYAPIYYADLMDLSDIIRRKDNWKDVFSAVFKDPDDFQVAMRRLNPIRHAVAHGRPLVRTDQLILCAEALRLLRALGLIQ